VFVAALDDAPEGAVAQHLRHFVAVHGGRGGRGGGSARDVFFAMSFLGAVWATREVWRRALLRGTGNIAGNLCTCWEEDEKILRPRRTDYR
jgi:hypothetical protein